MKTILVTGIGGLTPRSIAGIIRKNHPNYRIVGCDADPKAMGFYMHGLLDVGYVCPRCDDAGYFPWLRDLVEREKIDYAFVQPEAEIVAWATHRESTGNYPCPTLMGGKAFSESLRDKAIMASLLEGTEYIPITIRVTQDDPHYDEVEREIGYPCWIRATRGTGGLGSLMLENRAQYANWLLVNRCIPEFTVSEYLSGRHLANEMLYYDGEYIKGAALECAEYVMATTAPSHVTGNTHFGRFLNEDEINLFCNRCVKYLESKLNEKPHGVLSFDLKEDAGGNLKVTEVNIRHMAYTGVMARAGFDLIEDTIHIIEEGGCDVVKRAPCYHWDKPYVFLRDVDVEPILLESEQVFEDLQRYL